MASSKWIKPKIVVSKCIEFDYCRWNGNIIRSSVVEVLKSHVEFIPVCAEVEIGLGAPRDPIRIVLENGEKRLVQPSTGRDVTELMNDFSSKFLDSLEIVDGFILKSKSPSCGLFQTKYLSGPQKGASTEGRGPGFFGGAIIEKYGNLAMETEGRLKNFRIREHFLTKLYTMADLREVKKSNEMHSLVEYQTKNKFLFQAFSQEKMRELGRIVANPQKLNFKEVVNEYEKKLCTLLESPPKYTSNINVLMHSLGYFSKNLTHEEKAYFLDELEKYRAGWIPLFAINLILKSWTVRFNQNYLQDQTFFEPYPEELMTFDIKDTWRGRDYWK
ncbi:MAG: DUF1722 domain-containing protein [Promethearchaeota archaeon]|nr:MAG: DUF1722 domain-containing protein [Candidatus Lokiarchaeota archaeon]